MARAAIERQFPQDFPDHRCEFKAMAGAGRGDNDARRTGQPVDNEVVVRRHGVEAGLGGQQRAVRRRDVIGKRGADQRLVGGADGALDRIGIDSFIGMMVLGDLHTRVAMRRKAVVHAVPAFEQEYWEAARLELSGIGWFEPRLNLARHPDPKHQRQT